VTTISEIFTDIKTVRKIQKKLPELFYIAELESSRAGKVGMEVGSARERILIALLIHKFGPENVETNIPIIEPEVDVRVFERPVSIKTMTGKKLGAVKIIWTVDADQTRKFSQTYEPSCDILLAQINWGGTGALYYFPNAIQQECLNQIGRKNYIKLPKVGTNPRGVEISSTALNWLANHSETLTIPIEWKKREVVFNPYQRWIEFWEKD
jgi:hypothetical protein